MSTMLVTVPPGYNVHSPLTVQAPNGQQFLVQIPPGVMPGQQFQAVLPVQTAPVQAQVVPAQGQVMQGQVMQGQVMQGQVTSGQVMAAGVVQPGGSMSVGMRTGQTVQTVQATRGAVPSQGRPTESANKVDFNEPSDTKWRDKPWAVGFWFHIIGIIALTAWGASLGVPEAPVSDVGDGNSTAAPAPSDDGMEDLYDAFPLILGSIVPAIIFAVGYMHMMRIYAKSMITVSMYIAAAIALFFCAVMIIYGGIFGVIFGLIMMVFLVFYYRMIRSRIPFATAVLTTCMTALEAHPMAVRVQFYSMLPLVGWAVLWIACVVFTSPHVGSELYQLLLCLSYYWSMAVIQNVVHVTVCGAVASWYFMPDAPSPVMASFKRARTTSFGSICFGSFIVAIIKLLRQIVREAMRRDGGVIYCCLNCILGYLDALVQYFNKYAYVYVGAYGKTFMAAGKECWNLMTRAGFEALWNDDLIGNVLTIGCIACGALNGGLLFLIASAQGLMMWTCVVVAVVAALIAIGFTALMTISVESGVATIFVLYTEDAYAFEVNHQDLHSRFQAALTTAYPTMNLNRPMQGGAGPAA